MADHSCALANLSATAAVRAGQLGVEGFHGDPADRLIVATALELAVPLVTVDDLIHGQAERHPEPMPVW